jgi:hypothetical protein
VTQSLDAPGKKKSNTTFLKGYENFVVEFTPALNGHDVTSWSKKKRESIINLPNVILVGFNHLALGNLTEMIEVSKVSVPQYHCMNFVANVKVYGIVSSWTADQQVSVCFDV